MNASRSHTCALYQARRKPCNLPSFTAEFDVATTSFVTVQILINLTLKGNSHQILLSEMSLPGVEALIEKLLPKILGRLGKENPSKRRCKVAFVQRKCAVMSSVSVRFLYARY